MTEGITPVELGRELGVAPSKIRRWLRAQGWQAVPYARWHLTPAQAAATRDHFRPDAVSQRPSSDVSG